MRISIIIPAYNEEKTLKSCIKACLKQSRKPNNIIVVNDGSTDNTGKIIDSFGSKIKGIHLEKNTGNKSYAQQVAINYVKDDIFIATDADTILDKNFVKEIEKSFKKGKNIVSVCGYVVSMKDNWITACREIEYIIGQDLHKTAQFYINSILILPGCATGFRTKFFKKYISFDHDTIAEDLDFSYKINNFKTNEYVAFNDKAFVYTQDPNTIGSYINQLKRWKGGEWQNIKKHFYNVNKKFFILDLSISYIEGFLFALILIFLPFINMSLYVNGLIMYFYFSLIVGIYCSIKRRRVDLLFYSFFLIVFSYINSIIFLLEFYKQIIKNDKTLLWFKPKRRDINI